MSTTSLAPTGFRDPYELLQLPMSCMSNVTAQARWMLGLSDTQGPAAIAEVDALVGRADGEHAEPDACLRLLAQDGCRITDLSDFDLDLLRTGGVEYVRSRRKPGDWSAADVAHWTPARLSTYMTRAERLVQARADSLGRFERVRFEIRRPVFADVTAMLTEGMLVVAMVQGSSPGTSHAILVYDLYFDEGKGCNVYRMYWPRRDGKTLGVAREGTLADMWLGQSLTGVAR